MHHLDGASYLRIKSDHPSKGKGTGNRTFYEISHAADILIEAQRRGKLKTSVFTSHVS
jgi:hypothetical protein